MSDEIDRRWDFIHAKTLGKEIDLLGGFAALLIKGSIGKAIGVCILLAWDPYVLHQ